MARRSRKGSMRKARKGTKKKVARRSKAELSRSRNHIPTKVLETYLAGMPRRMHKLASLIKQRRAAGE